MAGKRTNILTLIRCDVATAGEISRESIRLYVENRISRAAFNVAVDDGMKIYRSRISRESLENQREK